MDSICGYVFMDLGFWTCVYGYVFTDLGFWICMDVFLAMCLWLCVWMCLGMCFWLCVMDVFLAMCMDLYGYRVLVLRMTWFNKHRGLPLLGPVSIIIGTYSFTRPISIKSWVLLLYEAHFDKFWDLLLHETHFSKFWDLLFHEAYFSKFWVLLFYETHFSKFWDSSNFSNFPPSKMEKFASVCSVE